MSPSLQNLFSSYHVPSQAKFKDAWQTARFVFDANVLLNLYRYSHETRKQMLSIIEALAERIWIPHHAALEFERNRLKVISEQKSMFAKVRKIVNDNISALQGGIKDLHLEKRHPTIDAARFLKAIGKLAGMTLHPSCRKLEGSHIDVTHDDKIYGTISELFSGRVGDPFERQNDIDQISIDYDRRLKYKIPPGFRDSAKSDAEEAHFVHDGIIYPRQVGDLIS